MLKYFTLILSLFTASIAAEVESAQPWALIDITDPGMDVDDTLALMVLTHRLEMADALQLVVSSDETADWKRARLARSLLDQSRNGAPVCAGACVDGAEFFISDQYLSKQSPDRDYVALMTFVIQEAKKQNHKVLIHAHGSMIELRDLLQSDPTIKDQIDAVVIMAGSFDRVEHNVGRDVAATEYVMNQLGDKARWVTVNTTASNENARIQPDAPLIKSWMTTDYTPLLTESIQKFEVYLNGRYPYSLAHDLISLAACHDVMFPGDHPMVQFTQMGLTLGDQVRRDGSTTKGVFTKNPAGTQTWVSQGYDFTKFLEWSKP